MTCSLLRSRTAVTVVVQDWPFRAPILPSRRDSSRAPTRTPPQVPSLSDSASSGIPLWTMRTVPTAKGLTRARLY